MTPEPKDKLDATAAKFAEVNGPQDALAGWHQVDWRRVERKVRRLRQRIFTASKAGDLVVTPNDFPDLDTLERQLLAFGPPLRADR